MPASSVSISTEKKNLDRSGYIGGSDAAAICGLSRWKSPLQVWAEKTGKIKEEDISDLLHIKLGNKLEQTVCELFMEETGKKLYRVNETIFHPEYDFIAANIDRRVVGEDAIFEAKTCSAWKSKEWEGEEIPQEYIIQCWHYLMVTGKARCYLAVLIGNQDFKWKVIERNDAGFKDLLNREILFWKDYVKTDLMPSVITRIDGDTLSKLYPVADEAKEIILGDDANQLIEHLQSFKSDKINLEGLIDQTENQLKALMKDSIRATTGTHEVRWINSKTSRLDAKSLLEEMPDIHKKYYKSNPVRRFSYKKLSAEAD